MKNKYKGEILITHTLLYVVAIIFFLGAGILAYTSIVGAGKNDKALADTSLLASKISQYNYEIGSYPTNLDALKTAVGQYGPWVINDIPNDPWSNSAYQYSKDDAKGYIVFSVGQNSNAESSIDTGISGDDLGFRGK